MGGEKATEAIIQGSQPDPMQESESQKRFCCYWIQALASLPRVIISKQRQQNLKRL